MSNELLTKLEEERKYLQSYNKKTNLIGGAIIALGVIFLITGFNVSGLFIAGVATIVVGVVVISVMQSNPNYRKRKKQMKLDLVNWYLDDKGYENYNYNPSSYLDWNIFYKLGLINEAPDLFNGEDLITGEYKNVKFSMSDLTLQRKERHVDSKGHSTTTIVTYFKGKVIIVDYPKTLDCDCTLLDRTDVLFSGKSDRKIETEVIEFNKKFNIYTSDKGTVFKILSPHMIQKILEFKKLQRGKVSLSFTRDKLYIVVNNNSDLAEIKLNKELTKDNISAYLGELLIPAAIVNEFRFDSFMYQGEKE